jgi:hypothetical protein
LPSHASRRRIPFGKRYEHDIGHHGRPRSDLHAEKFAGFIRTDACNGSSRSADHWQHGRLGNGIGHSRNIGYADRGDGNINYDCSRRSGHNGYSVGYPDSAFGNANHAISDDGQHRDQWYHTVTIDDHNSEPNYNHHPQSEWHRDHRHRGTLQHNHSNEHWDGGHSRNQRHKLEPRQQHQLRNRLAVWNGNHDQLKWDAGNSGYIHNHGKSMRARSRYAEQSARKHAAAEQHAFKHQSSRNNPNHSADDFVSE